jgi:16S rRNA (guanine527-N7)-methyltransferase
LKSISYYFPNLTSLQFEKLDKLKSVYENWNSKINVISRKDLDSFYIRHVLHSLAIAKLIEFKPGTKVLDVGTGGGFPGIPLSILFPETEFYLADSIGKKITVVNAVAEELELNNVIAKQTRVEEIPLKFDFIVSRAVTQVDRFIPWVKDKFIKESKNELSNGYLFLKGGDLKNEFKGIKNQYEEHSLSSIFAEDFFETKKLIYMKA